MNTHESLLQTIRLRAIDTDFTGRLSMQALFIMMQEIAFSHSELLSCGPLDMARSKKAWILSRAHVKMDKMPRFGEEIRLLTWPGPPARMLYPRYFTVENAQCARIGAASTLWVVLDLENRRISRLSDDIVFPDTSALVPPMPTPGKLRLPECEHAGTRHVHYSDLDIQVHLNNTRYAGWICDLFPLDLYEHSAVNELQINYISEILPDSTVSLQMAQSERNYFIRGEGDGLTRFEARAVFSPNI